MDTLTEVRNVQEIGHSHLICLPAIWCRANDVKKGTKLLIELHPDHLVIYKDNGKQDIQPDARATKILLESPAKAPKSKYARPSA